jgi:pimeloyl-ACP methyl ester carboxylesterase
VVDDVELAYVESGQLDSDKVVLFVHGAPEQAYIWRNIMPYVENYARVIAVEHIGHGLSGLTSQISITPSRITSSTCSPLSRPWNWTISPSSGRTGAQ